MTSTTRVQHRYDHRLRELVRSTGDVECAIRRGVPRSTARGWLTSNRTEVITVDVADMDALRLQQEVLELRDRVQRLVALLRIMAVLLKVSGFSLEGSRLPDGTAKITLLRAIERSRSVLSLRIVLRLLRLSQSRYHSWKREQECGLDDVPSCPRTSPQQLTSAEVETVKQMVTSDEYRHVPTGTLAQLAQRLGKVFASPTTWYRLVRCYKWRRPRGRVYPASPKVGIRASRPNEIWHVDTTLIRLLDGSRGYLHAVIDNFSRRILAWKVCAKFDPDTYFTVTVWHANDKSFELSDLHHGRRQKGTTESVFSSLVYRISYLVNTSRQRKAAPTADHPARDRRLPMPGTLLVRRYQGKTLQVKVLQQGFEYEGDHFGSLTSLTEKITGRHWNGYHFFGLQQRDTPS